MDLLEAVAVTYELVGHQVSDLALRAVVQELAQYPESDVVVALKRCQREVKGRLSLADIIDRIPNQHPGVETAWARLALGLNNDDVTLVWTDEMRQAFFVARGLADNPVAARMAFKETYERLVGEARAAGRRPCWSISGGHKVNGRDPVIEVAVQQGLLSREYANRICPPDLLAIDAKVLDITKRIGNQ